MAHLDSPDNGKKKKAIFLGYDGCRVDALKYVNKTERESYINAQKKYSADEKKTYLAGKSALSYLLGKENTGLYFAYAGGEKAVKLSKLLRRLPAGLLCSQANGLSRKADTE